MKRNHLPQSACAVGFALIAAGYASADEARYRDVFSSDSQPLRIPAITVLPEHPSRADRAAGEATVCFAVDTKGRVVDASVRSSTERFFERPALKAIRASTFEPLPADDLQARTEGCRTYLFDVGSTGSLPSSSAPPSERLAAAVAAAGASAAELTVPSLEGETICKTETRAGSRIAERVCYTRQQAAATAEANERTRTELEREAHWRDQAIHEAVMENRYPTGPGLGPL